MNPNQNTTEEIPSAQLEETESYRSLMLRWYSELIETYAAFDVALLSGRGDDNLLNILLSQLRTIGKQLLPKVKGGGSNLKDLIPEYDTFKEWFDNISVVKQDLKQLDRIPELYDLIIRTYDILGITTLN